MKLTEFDLVIHKAQPAVITGFDGEKIEIETPGGKKKVREKDFELLHTGPVKTVKKALETALPPGDLMEAYDFFSGETPSFAEIAELVWGNYAPDAAWAIWQAVAESPWFQAESPSQPVKLRPRDEAEAIIRKADAKREEGAERDAFKKRLSATLKRTKSGANENGENDGIKLPEDGKFLQDVEALALGKSDKSRTMKESALPETPEAAHRVLLATGYWPLWKNPWPSRHGHTLQTSSVPVEAPDDTDDRLDLTHLDSYAIDNAWSTDPDDAVSIDGDKLWVHIADPAATVTPDSAADRDARSRGSTLYVPEGAARMLADSALEYYALGLSPVSRALSFGITFTETGAVADVEIRRTRVRVTRMTYAGASAKRDTPELSRLFAIAARNIERRNAAGAVSIDLPETHLSVTFPDDAATPPTVSFTQVESESAADMVREMMLLAGEAMARFAFKNKIPFQYVSQEAPDIPKELPPGLAGEYRKRRSMKSRKVGTIPADHAGLGLGMYSQVTSPLRRYGDLVSHQQIHLFLDGKPLMDTDDMLTRIAQGDSASRECTFAERKSNLHWMLVHLALHPEWEGDAVLVEQNGNLTTVLIPEFAQESKLALSGDAALGSTIRVRAGNVNIPAQTVSFIPV
jgi:exoribonuclease-2